MNLAQAQIAFPGQSVHQIAATEYDAAHVRVPNTPENEALLKRRGCWYEVTHLAPNTGWLCVYDPNESLMND